MRALLLSALVLAVGAAPAQAAEVVKIDGMRLLASDLRGSLCVELALEVESGEGVGESCADPPVRAFGTITVNSSDEDGSAVGGAAPPSVARVEAEREDGTRFGAETVAGERYRGRHAGKVRFFLLAVPGGRIKLLRQYDAAGVMLGAIEPDYGAEPRPAGGPVRLLRVRGKRSRITLAATVQESFAPTPLALDRFERLVCLNVSSRQPRETASGGLCQDPGPFRPLLGIGVQGNCGRLRSLLYGFVGSSVDGVRLRLGSGRTMTVRARTLPDSIATGQRVVAAFLPRGEAVRRATAIGAHASAELREPPGGLPCEASDGLSLYGLGPPRDSATRPEGPDQQVAAEDGGHRLLVRDGAGDRLCSGVDRLRADGFDCELPPVDADVLVALERDGYVSAVLPADVARVRLPSGREVPSVEGAGYTGRYAGRVRFLLARVPPGTDGTLRYFDASGVLLGRGFVSPVDPPAAAGPITLARGPGWRLGAVRYGTSGCVALAAQLNPFDCFAEVRSLDSVYIVVSCRPRLAVLYGTLERSSRVVRVGLRGGRVLRPRVIRVPRAIGRGRAYVLALPRRAEVVSLRLGDETIPLAVLPATRQCGYELSRPSLG